MKRITLLLFILPFVGISQSYTNYFTGSPLDVTTLPQGGVCLMGGATEHDEAMKWFLERADGGDILVLRTSGSDGYNDYMFSQLGVIVNSVETIVFNNSSASNDSYVQQKISQAEAIWFAGGDQWNYVSYWRNTPVDSLINIGLEQRNIVIGGTSAGMAIQGKYYFSAENGTVTSSTALANPYDVNVTVDSTAFLKNDYLEDVVTDTHYDNPDRKGRHAVFLARILTDYGVVGKGIACDEYTAVCIDENGLASAYGEWPTYNENVYFIQPNCELTDFTPEDCSNGNSLEWNHNGDALKVYHIKATMDGANTFSLADWSTGVGGTWKNWRVINGILQEIVGDPIDCSVGLNETESDYLEVFPNPTQDQLTVITNENWESLAILDLTGKTVYTTVEYKENTLNISVLPAGVYIINVSVNGIVYKRKFVKE
ncbi:MAG: T9SS type A sorting domain-containing protein [Crocinitomicaceae bacterium]|nr:T9SS type A sorting domain-containing protein [Crocinitomicaceae bacterium]